MNQPLRDIDSEIDRLLASDSSDPAVARRSLEDIEQTLLRDPAALRKCDRIEVRNYLNRALELLSMMSSEIRKQKIKI